MYGIRFAFALSVEFIEPIVLPLLCVFTAQASFKVHALCVSTIYSSSLSITHTLALYLALTQMYANSCNWNSMSPAFVYMEEKKTGEILTLRSK